MIPKPKCTILQHSDPETCYQCAIKENPNNANNRPRRSLLKAVSPIGKQWSPYKLLKVAFIDDTPIRVQRIIETAALAWQPYINLSIVFVKGKQGDIRITTNPEGGFYSAIGTDSLAFSDDEATMNLTTNTSIDYLITSTKHEFGHALGLSHEHQHPDAGIPWNKPKVYEFYRKHQKWTRKEIYHNVLRKVPDRDFFKTPYDAKSIMHYEVENELTDGDWSTSENSDISDGDIKLIKWLYPL